MCILNFGLFIGPLSFGIIIQETKKEHNYYYGISLLIFMSIVLLILILTFHIMDLKTGGLLEKSSL